MSLHCLNLTFLPLFFDLNLAIFLFFNRQMPKFFHVNWFRLNAQGKFLWPGFGENIRVLDWIFRRCNGEDIAMKSPVGLLPKPGEYLLPLPPSPSAPSRLWGKY